MKLYKNLTPVLFLFFTHFIKGVAQNADPLAGIVQEEKARWLHQHSLEARGFNNNADNKSDILYDRVHWMVDPAINYIKGEVMTLFKPTENISTLDFDFAIALTMDSIVYHRNKIGFSRQGDVVSVNFPLTIGAAIPDSLTFFYQGVPVPTGFGSFNFSTHNSSPIVWTLSEPYNAKDWWPCKQALTDKIDSIDIFITNPEKYKAASNGILQSETTVDGQKTAHWKHRYPIATYLVCMAVTNYTTFTLPVPFGNEITPIVNYVYPESLTAAQAGVADNVKHMQLYDQLFGLYPFQNEKYGHAQFNWGGGAEHQTMTFVTSFGFELLAHELAHHWFGDKVTCGSWQDIWLNEGFATYLSGLCYEHLAPQFWQQFKQVRINDITSQPGGSVFVTDTSNINRIFDNRLSYAKGAMVIHLLRWICGDTAFFNGLRAYLNDPALAYGYAKTTDLQNHLEQASGKKLDGIFADWFKGEGYPTYTLQWSQDGSNQVSVHINQKQSHPSVSYFKLPLPLRLHGGAGQIKNIILDNTFDGQNFTDQAGFKVSSIEFDPDLWLITRDNIVSNVLVGTDDLARLDFSSNIEPNPVQNEQVHLVLEAATGGEITITLMSEDGKIVNSKTENIMRGTNQFMINTNGCPGGIYILRMKSAREDLVKKVIIL